MLIQSDDIHVLARAIIVDEAHILLAQDSRQEGDYFYLPGGHIEHGELAIQSLERELIEEVGDGFSVGRFLGCVENEFSDGCPIIQGCHTHEYNLIFEAHSTHLKAGTIPPPREEFTLLSWVPIKDLSTIQLLPPILKELIPFWLESDFDGAFQTNQD